MKRQIKSAVAALALFSSLLGTIAQPTAFTYQGRLTDRTTGRALNGHYDLRFTLYDHETGPSPLAGPSTATAVRVSNGQFTTNVDFGPIVFTVFNGEDRWLEIEVSTNTAGAFTTVAPRLKLLSVPYAFFAHTATNLAGTLQADQLTGTLPAEVLVGADGGGLTNLDASDLAAGTVPDGRLSPNVARTDQVWLLGGNASTTPGVQFLGTTDDKALEFKVHASRAFRIEPNTNSPNIIGGYSSNVVEAGTSAAIIGGGGQAGAINRISTGSSSSTIAGGSGNVIRTNSPFAVIAGGVNNTVGGDITYGGASIGGGNLNEILAYSTSGTIGGGAYNTLTNAPYATIAGGAENEADAWDAAIGGGAWNRVWHSADHATISGGYANTIKSNAESAVISGGLLNLVEMNAFGANIGGGATNSVMGSSVAATIGGGVFNQIRTNASYGTIGGGSGNIVEPHAYYGTIGGGVSNEIGTVAFHGTIGGGFGNTIQPFASYATVAGGLSNSANSYGFAAGRRAKANHEGAFVWADSSNADFASTTNNQFLIRASGGVGIGTNAPAARLDVNGTTLLRSNVTVGEVASVNFGSQTRQMLNLYNAAYGVGVQDFTLYFRTDSTFSWFRDGSHTNAQNQPGPGGVEMMRLDSSGNLKTLTGTIAALSDRESKTDFRQVDSRTVLDRVAALNIQTWRYKTHEPSERHLGPVAQDFYAAFGVGLDDRSICTVDADGVALAAIQGLNEIVKEKDAKIGDLEKRLADLERIVSNLNRKGE